LALGIFVWLLSKYRVLFGRYHCYAATSKPQRWTNLGLHMDVQMQDPVLDRSRSVGFARRFLRRPVF
jgi:hypothetical protein